MKHRHEEGALAQRMDGLEGWELSEGKLKRSFEFFDFAEAFAFMTRVALIAEQLGHHPDWSNSWSRVDIALYSHEEGGVTDIDLEMARLIGAIT